MSESLWTEKVRSAARGLAKAIQVGQVPPGDVAALRRARPGDPGGPALWKLALRYLEPDMLPEAEGPWREDAERRWAAILAGLAEMRDVRGPSRQLGSALAAAGVSEARVLRLLRARDVALLRVVRNVVHQLASSGNAADPADLAELVLSDGKTHWEAAVRRRIARDYYRSAPAEGAEAEKT